MTAKQVDGLTVFLSDGHNICIDVSCQELTAQQVIEQIFHKLNINFDISEHEGTKLPIALWSCSRSLRLQLMPEHNVKDIRDKMKNLIKNIPDEINESGIVLRLARNGFYEGEDELIEDKGLLELLYFEAKTNIESNVYPMPCLEFNDMIHLRVIKDLIEKRLKNAKEDEKTSCDANRSESKTLAPITLPSAAKAIKSELTYKNTIRKKFLTRSVSMYAKRQISKTDYESMSLDSLYVEYLRICRTLDCYGGFIFEGQMERSFIESITHRAYHDKKVSIIINKKGLHVVNMQCPKKLETFSLTDLEYGVIIPQKEKYYPCLYLQNSQNAKSSKNSKKLFQIFTYHAPFIVKTLKNFIEDKRK